MGNNLKINRTIIAFDVEKGRLWKKVGVLMRIKSEASRICESANIPMISLVLYKMPGAILYEGSDYEVTGAMAAQQVVQILKNKVIPESLPIASQNDLNIMVDTNVMKKLNIQLPMEILQIAKSVE